MSTFFINLKSLVKNKYSDYIKKSNCDGCVVTYKGFHPHMLNNTNYAYVKLKDSNIIDIQEKKPFTSKPMEEDASSGTYFFKSASLMEKYFKKTIENNLNINGEFYVSMSYKPMIEDKLKLITFNLDFFMQWGTPEDLREYNWYSNLFKSQINQVDENSNFLDNATLLIPCAGEGQRFLKEGYIDPKPFIKVSNKPMLLRAIEDLPNVKNKQFIFRNDMRKLNEISSCLINRYPDSTIQLLNEKTKGQASTCLLGLKNINQEAPLIISACDNGLIYNFEKLDDLLNNKTIDIIVWGCREYPGAIKHPNMYGWIAEENNIIKKIEVKKVYKDKFKDPIVTGTFYFRKASTFKIIANELIKSDIKINNEFYVDSCINNAISHGYKVVYFEVDFYLSWGTPNELKTYEYWLECFNIFKSHSYKKEFDKSLK